MSLGNVKFFPSVWPKTSFFSSMASSASLPNYLSFENQRTRCLDIGFNPDEGLLQDPQKHRSNDVKQRVSVPFLISFFF